MKTALLIIGIGLIAVVIVLVLAYQDSALSIERQIEKANYCTVKEDCAEAGGKCPFGCYVYVNEAEVDRISSLIESYDSKCIYSCIYCPDVECRDSRCEPVCE